MRCRDWKLALAVCARPAKQRSGRLRANLCTGLHISALQACDAERTSSPGHLSGWQRIASVLYAFLMSACMSGRASSDSVNRSMELLVHA